MVHALSLFFDIILIFSAIPLVPYCLDKKMTRGDKSVYVLVVEL